MSRKGSSFVFAALGVSVIALVFATALFASNYLVQSGFIAPGATVLVHIALAVGALVVAFPGFVFLWLADMTSEIATLRATLDAIARSADGARAAQAAARTEERMQPFMDQGEFDPQRGDDLRRDLPPRAGYDRMADHERRANDRASERRAARPAPVRDRLERRYGGEADDALHGADRQRPDRDMRDRTADAASERSAPTADAARLDVDRASMNGRARYGAPEAPPASDPLTMRPSERRSDPDISAIERNGRTLRRPPPPLRDPAAELDALLREQERRGRRNGMRSDDLADERPAPGRIPY